MENSVEDNRSDEKVLIEKGMKIEDVSPELMAIFIERSKQIWEDHMKEVPESRQVIEDYLSVIQ